MSCDDPRHARRLRAVLAMGLVWVVAAWMLVPAFPQSVTGAQSVWSGLSSPDLSPSYVARALRLSLESIALGLLGTALAIAIAVPLALLVARLPGQSFVAQRTPSSLRLLNTLVRGLGRLLLGVLRSVPDLVWAFLFVRILGLGTGPAVLAIGVSVGGTIGRLLAELIESAEPGPAAHLWQGGAHPVAVFAFAVWPAIKKRFAAYCLFRLECAIRTAAVVGIVGAGGLGQEMELSMRYFQYDKLATCLYALLAYVVVLELLSRLLRRVRFRWFAAALCVGCLVSLAYVDTGISGLLQSETWTHVRFFLFSFAEPNTSGTFLKSAIFDALETLVLAAVATSAGAVVALALAPWGLRELMVPRAFGVRVGRNSRGARHLLVFLVRLVQQTCRAVPTMVWAMVFVLCFGPGPVAGLLALFVHTVGVLSRLYSDSFEEISLLPVQELQSQGAHTLAAFRLVMAPQAMAQMVSFSFFRFEVNLRDAAVLGFVGAGGLGDSLHTAVSLFHWRDLATLLIVTLALVTSAEFLSTQMRHRLLPTAIA